MVKKYFLKTIYWIQKIGKIDINDNAFSGYGTKGNNIIASNSTIAVIYWRGIIDSYIAIGDDAFDDGAVIICITAWIIHNIYIGDWLQVVLLYFRN